MGVDERELLSYRGFGVDGGTEAFLNGCDGLDFFAKQCVVGAELHDEGWVGIPLILHPIHFPVRALTNLLSYLVVVVQNSTFEVGLRNPEKLEFVFVFLVNVINNLIQGIL